MMRAPLLRGTATLLIATLLLPTSLLLVPQRAEAAGGCVIGLAIGAVPSVAKNSTVAVPVSDAPGAVGSLMTSGSSLATCLYDTIVVPLLRQMIRNILKQITDATIAWINGSNSTGQPSFVPNLSVHLRLVADSATLRFIQSMASALKNPFGTVISRLSQRRYQLGSSLAGFYADNQCTLDAKWTEPGGFLDGDWNKGGTAAWLALTTQPQNNPYMLNQRVYNQALQNAEQATINRRQDLIQSGGILSFCPGNANANLGVQLGAGGINPQISCTDPQGKPVKATTPGSAISSYLNTNLGSGVGQLVSAQDLDAAIGAVVSALAQKVIGPGGLFGAGQGGGGAGVNIPLIPSSAGDGVQNSALAQADAAQSNINTYRAAWLTTAAAANSAQTEVTNLITFCNAQLGTGASEAVITAVVTEAQGALANEISPVLADAQDASTLVTNATASVATVRALITATSVPDPVAYSNSVATLSSMSPSLSEALTARTNAQSSGGAKAEPAGSLTVSGGSTVDQMNLITIHAVTRKASCAASGGGGGGGGEAGGGG